MAMEESLAGRLAALAERSTWDPSSAPFTSNDLWRIFLNNISFPEQEDLIDKFQDECMSGDYDHLLQVCMQWVNVG